MNNQKLAQDLKAMMEKFNSVKKANSVTCDAPEVKRSYTYRKTTVITGLEAIVKL